MSHYTYSARQAFHSRTEEVYQAHAKVQQLLDTASTQAFIADAPDTENMLDQQICDTSQPWCAANIHRLSDNFVSHGSSVVRRPSGIVDEDMFKWNLPTNDVKKVRQKHDWCPDNHLVAWCG